MTRTADKQGCKCHQLLLSYGDRVWMVTSNQQRMSHQSLQPCKLVLAICCNIQQAFFQSGLPVAADGVYGVLSGIQ